MFRRLEEKISNIICHGNNHGMSVLHNFAIEEGEYEMVGIDDNFDDLVPVENVNNFNSADAAIRRAFVSTFFD